jgi:hypothetical protein
LAKDREKVRIILDLHDDFDENSILLSPLDASIILDALIFLPTWERTVFIVKAFLAGSCVS